MKLLLYLIDAALDVKVGVLMIFYSINCLYVRLVSHCYSNTLQRRDMANSLNITHFNGCGARSKHARNDIEGIISDNQSPILIRLISKIPEYAERHYDCPPKKDEPEYHPALASVVYALFGFGFIVHHSPSNFMKLYHRSGVMS